MWLVLERNSGELEYDLKPASFFCIWDISFFAPYQVCGLHSEVYNDANSSSRGTYSVTSMFWPYAVEFQLNFSRPIRGISKRGAALGSYECILYIRKIKAVLNYHRERHLLTTQAISVPRYYAFFQHFYIN